MPSPPGVRGPSPLYARLASAVAHDDSLLAVACTIPEGRSPPHLLLGGVHFLLLRGHGSGLAASSPSVVDDAREPADALVPAFEAFVAEHAARLRPILSERRTQTNAVGRCAALFRAFAYALDRLDAPPALVELGASAGLNRYWDRYADRYDGLRAGAADARVVVECELRGGAPPLPAEPPAVHSRVGLDLDPLDASDPADADWLRWPPEV